MHNIKVNFDKILGVIKDIIGDEINEKDNYSRPGTVPKFSDLEVIHFPSPSLASSQLYKWTRGSYRDMAQNILYL